MLRICLLAAVLTLSIATQAFAAPITIDLELDATDLPRKLLYAKMTVPAKPGTLSMWYPKWIPGIHAPRGPIQNMAGLRFETPDGVALDWTRDPRETYLFHCEVPKGVKKVIVSLDYICSQPSTNSSGVDSYGNSLAGVISWNTCLLYPDGYTSREVRLNPSLKLPEGWKSASSLITASHSDGVQHFETTTLETLIDSPTIVGENMRSIELDGEGLPPVYLDIVSESASALQIDEEIIESYGNMVTEAGLMFGGGHFDEYHLLLSLSDDLPRTGLEHLRSSLNGLGERALADADDIATWDAYLLPHEFGHSWCGKFRRPAGMDTPDFHAPKNTEGLWVYEGLDQYLGDILSVRAGLVETEDYFEGLTMDIAGLRHQKGRQWRPLRDTAMDSGHLRGGSRSWSRLRRGQDYYVEGLFLWMEVDGILRQETDNKSSIDDFCLAFFGPDHPDVEVHPFELDEIVETLNGIAEYEWETFLTDWVNYPHEDLPLEFVSRVGYRLQYDTEPSDALKDSEKKGNYIHAADSIGMNVSSSGKVSSSVVPGSPADEAGIAPGMEIIGVNDRKFSKNRMKDAINDSVTRGNIELMVAEGEIIRTITIDYDSGTRYYTLVRDESKPDYLSDIFAPRRADASGK